MLYKAIFAGLISILALSNCTVAPIEQPTDSMSTIELSAPTPSPLIDVPEIPLLEQREIMNIARIDQLLSFDSIRPVYAPHFVNAHDADMQPDDLVIGIAIEDEAKAYPVGVLRFREMVNDEIAGIPILVSW